MGRLTANLISNAIRYTPEKGSVSVSVDFREGEAVLMVSDTGIGIPEEDIPGIFTDFFRAKNARKFSPTGTGLGLSITRSIAEMHGGTVSVTSKLDAGTKFTVRLPAAVGRGNQTASPETPGVLV
jgi:signal transduction histidine kinase